MTTENLSFLQYLQFYPLLETVMKCGIETSFVLLLYFCLLASIFKNPEYYCAPVERSQVQERSQVSRKVFQPLMEKGQPLLKNENQANHSHLQDVYISICKLVLTLMNRISISFQSLIQHYQFKFSYKIRFMILSLFYICYATSNSKRQCALDDNRGWTQIT